jgi:nucleotide-binding universal stress UspA family protein
MIVMGMKNNSKIDKMLGSTISGVIRRSETPVLVIPQDKPFSTIRVVAYAADLSFEMNETSFSPVKKFIATWRASLQIVHIHKPATPVTQSEIAGKVRLANAAGEIPYLFHAIPGDNVEKGLHDYLEEHPADILAMTAHRHSFFERLFGTLHTRSMLYQTNIPLLILHDGVTN